MAHSPARSRGPQLQPRRRLELAARTAARSFSHRAELDLPVPQRRNCSPTPTKKEHRGPSRLKPPPGFPGPIPAPCSRVWERLECVCARSPCVRKTEVFDRLTQTGRKHLHLWDLAVTVRLAGVVLCVMMMCF
uniref:Uncharacterized protein n=1 Tax=Knipowitschia caucasica TaxID=637954 RepID=A0AAV2JNK1_KNICA